MSDEFNAVVMDHGVKPRHYGTADNWDGHAVITGPCGDTMTFWIEVVGNLVSTVRFTTDGCITSRAAGSMTATLAAKRSVTECLSVSQEDVLNALEGLPDEYRHCALLSSNTLKAACDNYLVRVKKSTYMPEDLIETCLDCTQETCSALARRENETNADWLSRQRLLSTLCKIKHKVFVLSGKGGVGKSSLSVNLAVSLSKRGFQVGLLDADLHGPSVPHMMREGSEYVSSPDDLISPVLVDGIKTMSMGYLSQDSSQPAIWRGPMKMNVIRQFVTEVDWGELDYLIVDSPPGTGDEALAIAQVISDADGAVVVTTPQTVALQSVSKCVSFCRELAVPVIGLVENLGYATCPECGFDHALFGRNGGKLLAEAMNIPLIGRLPYAPEMVSSCDNGVPFQKNQSLSDLGQGIESVVDSITDYTQQKENYQ